MSRQLSDAEAARWHYLNWLVARGEVERLLVEISVLKAALARSAA